MQGTFSALKLGSTLNLGRRGCVVFAVAAVLSGCDRSDRPPMSKVSGIICFQGRPLAQAKVSFIPEDKHLRPAMGTTDAQGRFTLTTYEPGDGAVTGLHRISVLARGPFTGTIPSHLGAAYAEEQEEKGPPLIPVSYFNPETSGLSEHVVGPEQSFQIDLVGEVTTP